MERVARVERAQRSERVERVERMERSGRVERQVEQPDSLAALEQCERAREGGEELKSSAPLAPLLSLAPPAPLEPLAPWNGWKRRISATTYADTLGFYYCWVAVGALCSSLPFAALQDGEAFGPMTSRFHLKLVRRAQVAWALHVMVQFGRAETERKAVFATGAQGSAEFERCVHCSAGV